MYLSCRKCPVTTSDLRNAIDVPFSPGDLIRPGEIHGSPAFYRLKDVRLECENGMDFSDICGKLRQFVESFHSRGIVKYMQNLDQV